MDTHLISLEVDLKNSLNTQLQAVNQVLNNHGNVLNWIASDVDPHRKKVCVDAIVKAKVD
jgi:hypothetical protein